MPQPKSVHTYLYLSIYIYICIQAHIQHVRLKTFIYTDIHTCIHSYPYTYIHIYILLAVHVDIGRLFGPGRPFSRGGPLGSYFSGDFPGLVTTFSVGVLRFGLRAQGAEAEIMKEVQLREEILAVWQLCALQLLLMSSWHPTSSFMGLLL